MCCTSGCRGLQPPTENLCHLCTMTGSQVLATAIRFRLMQLLQLQYLCVLQMCSLLCRVASCCNVDRDKSRTAEI